VAYRIAVKRRPDTKINTDYKECVQMYKIKPKYLYEREAIH
jgi:hypothetical protein